MYRFLGLAQLDTGLVGLSRQLTILGGFLVESVFEKGVLVSGVKHMQFETPCLFISMEESDPVEATLAFDFEVMNSRHALRSYLGSQQTIVENEAEPAISY